MKGRAMTRRDKSALRYGDYYCFMSLADFTAWVATDGDSFEISTDSREVKQ
jgi:hypothetical protein